MDSGLNLLEQLTLTVQSNDWIKETANTAGGDVPMEMEARRLIKECDDFLKECIRKGEVWSDWFDPYLAKLAVYYGLVEDQRMKNELKVVIGLLEVQKAEVERLAEEKYIKEGIDRIRKRY